LIWLFQGIIKKIQPVKGRQRVTSEDGAKLRILIRGSKVCTRRCGERIVAKALQDRAKSTCEEERSREEAHDLRGNDPCEVWWVTLKVEYEVCRGEMLGKFRGQEKGRPWGMDRTRGLAEIIMSREQTCRLTMCKVNVCKVCEYGPCEVTEIPLRCFAQCGKAMASVVKRNCYEPIKRTQR
jgi:hypothetical protein